MTKERISILLRLTFLLSFSFFNSCIEEISIVPDDHQTVVVQCVLRNTDIQSLKLYRLRGLYETSEIAITDAKPSLLAYNDKTSEYYPVAEFKHVNNINWECDYRPEYGTKYKLLIKIPGENDIYAQSTFPEDLKLVGNSKNLTKTIGENERVYMDINYRVFSFEVRVAESSENINVYRNYYIRNYKYLESSSVVTPYENQREVDGKKEHYKTYTKLYNDSCRFWIFPHTHNTLDIPINQSYTHPEAYEYYGSDIPFAKMGTSDHPGADRFNISSLSVNDIPFCNIPLDTTIRPNKPTLGFVALEKYNISQWIKEYYSNLPVFNDFIRIIHPANFNNGCSLEQIKESHLFTPHSFILLFDHSYNFGIIQRYTFPFNYPYNDRVYSSGAFEVHFLSYEYDMYLRSIYQAEKKENDMISNLYDSSNIFSNITNGVGIFGADLTTWNMLDPYLEY